MNNMKRKKLKANGWIVGNVQQFLELSSEEAAIVESRRTISTNSSDPTKKKQMTWKVIKTRADYNKAVRRLMDIFHARAGTPEADELNLLLALVKDYEDKNIGLPSLNRL